MKTLTIPIARLNAAPLVIRVFIAAFMIYFVLFILAPHWLDGLSPWIPFVVFILFLLAASAYGAYHLSQIKGYVKIYLNEGDSKIRLKKEIGLKIQEEIILTKRIWWNRKYAEKNKRKGEYSWLLLNFESGRSLYLYQRIAAHTDQIEQLNFSEHMQRDPNAFYFDENCFQTNMDLMDLFQQLKSIPILKNPFHEN